MKTFLIILALIAASLGALSFIASHQAPIREIEALLFFLIAAVLISGSAVVAALGAIHQEHRTNGSKLDRLGAAIATPPEIADTPAATEEADTYLVQLSDGVRGTFTHAQLQAMLDRGIIDSRAFILPQGSTQWIRVSALTARS